MAPDHDTPLFTLQEQARALSSGTLANLTGFNLYDEIDPIRLDFLEFCEENAQHFKTWQPAWNVFWSAARSKYNAIDVKYVAFYLAEYRKNHAVFITSDKAKAAWKYAQDHQLVMETPKGWVLTFKGMDFIQDFIAD